MQQWEYIIVDVRLWRSGEYVYINGHPVDWKMMDPARSLSREDDAIPTLPEVLSWLGRNGWEMTGVAPDDHYSKLFFKRPVLPKPLPAPPPIARLTSGHTTSATGEHVTPPSSKKTSRR